MNIPQLSSAMSLANVQSNFGVAMLGKSLDDAKNSGASMVNMMNQSLEKSVNPSVGSNIDLRV
jgi:hypothetical protein